MRRRTSLRSGFTLNELLAVSAIVSVLVAMILPAIVAARASARRTQCLNNMRQVSLGTVNFESSHRHLPPGVVDAAGPVLNAPEGLHTGWIVHLLPFLEQQALAGAIDTGASVYDPVNARAYGTQMTTLLCPSDPGAKRTTGVGVSSYAACHHDVEAPIDADNHGVFFLNSTVRDADIADGRSHTVFFGETVRGPAPLGWMSGTRATLRNTGTLPNATPAAGRPDDPEYVGGFGSRHPGGANFAFGDGSVRFLRDRIDPEVYRRLGHRADGEMTDAGPP